MSGEGTMAQYACTQCMQWFQFDQLSQDKLMCSSCVEAAPGSSKESIKFPKKTKVKITSKRMNVCKYCQTDMEPKKRVCDRCLKNLNEHGKPKKCIYCKLQSAFIGSKCQRCSSSQKKYGPPVACNKCGIKSAFDHAKARINGSVLCWLCYVKMQRYMRKSKRKPEKVDDPATKVMRYSPSQPYLFNKDEEAQSDQAGQEEIWDQLDVEVGKKKNPKVQGYRSSIDPKHKDERKGGSLLRQAQLKYRKIKEKRDKHPGRSLIVPEIKTSSAPTSPSHPPASSAVKEEKSTSSGNTPKSDTDQSSSAPLWQVNDRMKNGANNMAIGILPPVNDGNIVMVTQLREEIVSLKKQVSKKDQQLIAKDKQISVLKVEHLTEVRNIQSKFISQEENYLKVIEGLRSKNQELLKKIAQISKGKA